MNAQPMPWLGIVSWQTMACLFTMQEVTCSLSSSFSLLSHQQHLTQCHLGWCEPVSVSIVKTKKGARSAVQPRRWCYLVGLHALAPLSLHTHNGHSHTEVELLVYWKGGEEFGDHAVYLQLHFTLHAVKTGLGQNQTYLAAESGQLCSCITAAVLMCACCYASSTDRHQGRCGKLARSSCCAQH